VSLQCLHSYTPIALHIHTIEFGSRTVVQMAVVETILVGPVTVGK